MTEPEWKRAMHPAPMLTSGGCTRPRKRHLCAYCRRVWRFVTDQRARAAFGIVERFVEGLPTEEELNRAEEVTCYGTAGGLHAGRSLESVR